MFPNCMRYVAKHVINPLLSRSAGSARSQFALISHVGRCSGKPYETPIMVFPKGEDFLIALTYGPKVDWYRNLRASGQGTLLWAREGIYDQKTGVGRSRFRLASLFSASTVHFAIGWRSAFRVREVNSL